MASSGACLSDDYLSCVQVEALEEILGQVAASPPSPPPFKSFLEAVEAYQISPLPQSPSRLLDSAVAPSKPHAEAQPSSTPADDAAAAAAQPVPVSTAQTSEPLAAPHAAAKRPKPNPPAEKGLDVAAILRQFQVVEDRYVNHHSPIMMSQRPACM